VGAGRCGAEDIEHRNAEPATPAERQLRGYTLTQDREDDLIAHCLPEVKPVAARRFMGGVLSAHGRLDSNYRKRPACSRLTPVCCTPRSRLWPVLTPHRAAGTDSKETPGPQPGRHQSSARSTPHVKWARNALLLFERAGR
jgi:hypothetical protein